MIKSKIIIKDNNAYIVTRNGKTVKVYDNRNMTCVYENTFRFVSEAKKWMHAPIW